MDDLSDDSILRRKTNTAFQAKKAAQRLGSSLIAVADAAISLPRSVAVDAIEVLQGPKALPVRDREISTQRPIRQMADLVSGAKKPEISR